METSLPKGEQGHTLTACLTRAGAVVVERDGRRVAAHYGSAAAELAVCLKSVGLAARSDLETLEVFGNGAWLESFLAMRLGDRMPAIGHAARILGGSWYARLNSEEVIVVGTPAAIARWRRLIREAIMTGGLLAAREAASHLVLSLIGPRVDDLLSAATLPAGLLRESVCACSFASGSAILVREDPHHALVLLDPHVAADGWNVLFDAGRALGLSPVGADAVARLRARVG